MSHRPPEGTEGDNVGEPEEVRGRWSLANKHLVKSSRGVVEVKFLGRSFFRRGSNKTPTLNKFN